MPNYLINEGLESEEVIIAARAAEGNIQWWFYDDCNRTQETRGCSVTFKRSGKSPGLRHLSSKFNRQQALLPARSCE
ncbi:hypothetical protein ARTHRO9V_90166 [Arthrobacter sp. 9V]|nr:hypothetical protein ARTHRO9V_90166 [Arthrobacter sp. 9V]